MHGEPGCFGWNGSGCVPLRERCPGKEKCRFYKPAVQAEKERLQAYESAGAARSRYERYDKKYWLMEVTDEFITDNGEAILQICRYRDLARRIRNGDGKAADEARRILG